MTSTRELQYLQEQQKRGMVDASSKEYQKMQTYVCDLLGEELSPEQIIHSVKLARGSCEMARTLVSDLGFSIDVKTEDLLSRYFRDTYKKPEKQ